MALLTQKQPAGTPAQSSQLLDAALGAQPEHGGDGMAPEERQALYDAVVQEMIKVISPCLHDMP